MGETLSERYADEILTDNTQIEYCNQCIDCINWQTYKIRGNNGELFDNQYDRANCSKYPAPQVKPDWVINNYGECDYYKAE